MNGGEGLGSVLRALEITGSMWNRWRSACGGMRAADVKGLKGLRVGNARLKRLLAGAESGKAVLKDLAEGRWRPGPSAGCCGAARGPVRGL